MENEKDYTFYLQPGGKTRWAAGSYDIKTQQPHYEIEISVPKHVRDQVEVNQFLLGTPDRCQWVWDINNRSSWPAFVVVKKDGELMRA